MNSILSALLPQLTEALSTLLAGVLVALVGAILAWVRKKTKIDALQLSADQENWIRAQAKAAALTVEEKLRESTGPAKMQAATLALMGAVAANPNVPDIGVIKAGDVLHSVLPELGLGASSPKAEPQ